MAICLIFRTFNDRIGPVPPLSHYTLPIYSTEWYFSAKILLYVYTNFQLLAQANRLITELKKRIVQCGVECGVVHIRNTVNDSGRQKEVRSHVDLEKDGEN